MPTFVRAPEAARLLGVTTPTLYSYVSRQRVTRTLGADGRTSLFEVAELTALREKNRRPPPPPPTIDVRVATGVTQLNENGVSYRGMPVAELVDLDFERVAELLWTGTLPEKTPSWPSEFDVHPRLHTGHAVMDLVAHAAQLDADADACTTARRLIMTAPAITAERDGRELASDIEHARLADRLAAAWFKRPDRQLADTLNAALVLLADHELATSTLAVRVAASVRSSPNAALIAGLAAVEGDLHGSASHYAHALFIDVAVNGAEGVLERYRADHQRVPGFGHSVYRQRDPRFEPLLDRVLDLPAPPNRRAAVTELIALSGRYVTHPPNIDLALGALTYLVGLRPDCPIFAIARIAGWAAHYLEEIEERPVRFRGLATIRG